ncbi:MAG: DUF86 domain-containing protein [Chlamydiae bacterium]|nr:DUF86 domain-containing protein [Chlamydiota bacterium]MBI3266918.1 DUF86 domain-containing protein [Chlamydiota bacterium]
MKDNSLYLLHIRDALDLILEYASSGKEFFMQDKKTQDAIIRNLEILGEATKNIQEDFRQVHSEIPWKALAGMRDKLAHDYFGVNLEIVWEVVDKRIQELKEKINNLLNN